MAKHSVIEETDYCPPLDTATFLAVINDYDLSNEAHVRQARETLDFLKVEALGQDWTLFDPSGNANYADTEGIGISEAGASSSDVCRSRSSDTDLSSLSNGMQTMDLGGCNLDYADNLTSPEKVALLQEMFPNFPEFKISHTLKKADGNYTRALEELLNHMYFADASGVVGPDKIHATGIDAFSEDNNVGSARKKRDRKRRKDLSDLDDPRSTSLPPTPKVSAWEKGKIDIEFISSRVNMTAHAVSSVYHANGTSISATIAALAESPPASSGAATPPSDDPVIQIHTSELGKEFPSIPPRLLLGIIRLTHPSTAKAHELATALVSPNLKNRGGIEVIPRYLPLAMASDDDITDSKSRTPSAARSSETSTDPAYHRARALVHNESADRSFAQASAAYRRGKSDRLMGGAAGYYSQVGRDHAMRRVEATSDAADALVLAQSSSLLIDLHGVSVKDAVRIARQKTEDWWQQGNRRTMGLDGRVRNYEGNSEPLRIVTGVGRHSQGGVARIGPAVGKVLMSEGWHLVFEEGFLEVVGRRKK